MDHPFFFFAIPFFFWGGVNFFFLIAICTLACVYDRFRFLDKPEGINRKPQSVPSRSKWRARKVKLSNVTRFDLLTHAPRTNSDGIGWTNTSIMFELGMFSENWTRKALWSACVAIKSLSIARPDSAQFDSTWRKLPTWKHMRPWKVVPRFQVSVVKYCFEGLCLLFLLFVN